MTVSYLRLLTALILSLSLTILPLPHPLSNFRPSWVLLFILYLEFFLFPYFNLIILFIVGLALDVLLSTVLGEHVFALLLVTWIASRKNRRFNYFSIGQQMAFIALLCLLYQLVIIIIEAFQGSSMSFMMVGGSAFTSSILWPWIKLIGNDTLQQKRKWQT